METADIIHYSQSADSLFNFMKQYDYLVRALKNKKLAPRYCEEDTKYLGLKDFSSIYVLQKCFCDIPLHEITKKNRVLTIEGKSSTELSHTDFYGEFGIAFSKDWCLSKNFQPIHYINEKSHEVANFEKLVLQEVKSDRDNNLVDNEIINRFCYMKPLTGIMPREVRDRKIYYRKNFHDECEWRFVPKESLLEANKLTPIIFNPNLKKHANEISNIIEGKKNYQNLCITFNYADIKYLIVPGKKERNELIMDILDLQINYMKRMTLISKIIVLDEMKEDW